MWRMIIATGLVLMLGACSAEKRDFGSHGGAGGAAGSNPGGGGSLAGAGRGGSLIAGGGNSGGASGTPDAGTGGALGDAGSSDAGGSDSGVGCVDASRRCNQGYPEQCSNGNWGRIAACAAPLLYCSEGNCLACQPGNYQCTAASLELCDKTGNWTAQHTCSGSTPICSAASGSCVSSRLVGGFSTLGVPSSQGGARVQGEFFLMPATCNSNSTACVRGGFLP